jgi:hypothetical protein
LRVSGRTGPLDGRGRRQRVRPHSRPAATGSHPRPVLASYGLTVHDDGSGSGFILANRTGHQVMVNTLSELWEAAERIIGRPVDPLDPRFAGEAPTP